MSSIITKSRQKSRFETKKKFHQILK